VTPLTKKDKLFLWSVARHTPNDREVDEVALQAGCDRLRFPPERVMWILKHHPSEWNRQMQKREARISGVPYPKRRQGQVQAALITNLKTRHPRKVKRMRRNGVPI
jgi:hypothetical protein